MSRFTRPLDSFGFNMKLWAPLSSQKGFTLVELLAVIVITGILLVVVSAIFVQIISSNTKATTANDIRENGQFMIEQVVRAVRNADYVIGSTTSGKSLFITVTSAGSSDTYRFECLGGSSTAQSLTKNSAQLNTSRVQVDVDCSGAISNAKSWFELTPSSAGAPATVRINLVLETTGTPTHQEYVGKQTLTELVSLRTYVR